MFFWLTSLETKCLFFPWADHGLVQTHCISGKQGDEAQEGQNGCTENLSDPVTQQITAALSTEPPI